VQRREKQIPTETNGVRVCHQSQPASKSTDKNNIQIKLVSWKGNMLSMMAMVQLINMVIVGTFSYIFQFYKWFMALLKDVDR